MAYAAERSAELSPRWRNREEMIQDIERGYGRDIARILAEHGSVKDQGSLVKRLEAAGLNGQSREVARLYQAHNQEFDRKESWYTRWTNRILAVPAAVGSWMWNNKLLTAAIILGVVGYYTGFGAALIEQVQKWLGASGDRAAGGHTGDVAPAFTPSNPVTVPPAQGTVDVPPQNPTYGVPRARLPGN